MDKGLKLINWVVIFFGYIYGTYIVYSEAPAYHDGHYYTRLDLAIVVYLSLTIGFFVISPMINKLFSRV